MKQFKFRNFDYSGWEYPAHTFVRNPDVREALFGQGYHIIPNFIDKKEIAELYQLFKDNHDIKLKDGGFFVSIFSKNLDYRNNIHKILLEKLGKKFYEVFTHYKYTCLNFMAKYPGTKGQLFVHQDMAQVDEMKYSQVGIWLPLQDVSLENGTMGILPYSHFTIPPYRTLYHNLPFSKIYPTAFSYMQPVEIKAGDLLLFDIRLLHNSFINSSKNPRVVIASSVVPEEAPFCICYRDNGTNNENGENDYDQIEVDDDFYLQFPDFRSEKVERPKGNASKKISIKERFVEEDEFLEFCSLNGIEKRNNKSYLETEGNTTIQEPVYAEEKVGGILNMFKSFLKK